MSIIVGLNIGGYIYKTTKATLCPNGSDNFFSGLLSGKFPSTKDEQGNYFIDRDGQYFKVILEFLRTGDFVIPAHMDPACIAREAQFYSVEIPTSHFGAKDEFFMRRFRQAAFKMYDKLLEEIYQIIYQDFLDQAAAGIYNLKSRIFLAGPEHVPHILNSISRKDFQAEDDCLKTLEQLKRKPKAFIEDHRLFSMLDEPNCAKAVVEYCKHKQGLSVKVTRYSGYDNIALGYVIEWKPP